MVAVPMSDSPDHTVTRILPREYMKKAHDTSQRALLPAPGLSFVTAAHCPHTAFRWGELRDIMCTEFKSTAITEDILTLNGGAVG